MKNPSSTTSNSTTAATAATSIRWISAGVIIVLMAAANTECSSIALQETLTNPHKFPNHQPQVSNSLSFSPSPPRLFLQARRLHQPPPQPPTPPPPSEGGDEIDPRYGIEKRLVPSGPNPLHN
ncbi:hypothetical protein Pfo_011494 [Paulownia fortunei]|nr:hypothetical protein Pfo_011494 [Paulownia fortunei]